NGLIDREHHRVYVLPLALSLLAYRPDPAEISGLAAVPANGYLALLAGHIDTLPAAEAVAVGASGTLTQVSMTVRRADLVPYSETRLRRILGSAEFNC